MVHSGACTRSSHNSPQAILKPGWIPKSRIPRRCEWVASYTAPPTSNGYHLIQEFWWTECQLNQPTTKFASSHLHGFSSAAKLVTFLVGYNRPLLDVQGIVLWVWLQPEHVHKLWLRISHRTMNDRTFLCGEETLWIWSNSPLYHLLLYPLI